MIQKRAERSKSGSSGSLLDPSDRPNSYRQTSLLLSYGVMKTAIKILFFIRCDLAIDSEKSLVFFLVDWASLHEATV